MVDLVELETRVAIDGALLALEQAALEAELGLATIKTLDMALAEHAAKMRCHRPEFDYDDLPDIPFMASTSPFGGSLVDELNEIDRQARADRYLSRHGVA